jgi:hypothetical protein
VQDKTALARGHAASAQPEPREKPTRSRGTDTKTTRSKNGLIEERTESKDGIFRGVGTFFHYPLRNSVV